MNRQRSIATCCAAFLMMAMSSVAAKGPVLTAQGEKIAAEYTKMLEDLRKEIVALAPKVDEKVKADFTERLGALNNVEPVIKRVMANDVTVKYGPGNPAFAEKQKEFLAAARAVIKKVETFLVGEKHQAIMAKSA